MKFAGNFSDIRLIDLWLGLLAGREVSPNV